MVWATDEEEFYSCPLLWVSPAVVSWYEEYSYYKEFTGAAPCFHKLHPAWLDAMREYNEYYRFFYELVNPKRGGSTDKGLSVLRESFKNRG